MQFSLQMTQSPGTHGPCDHIADHKDTMRLRQEGENDHLVPGIDHCCQQGVAAM